MSDDRTIPEIHMENLDSVLGMFGEPPGADYINAFTQESVGGDVQFWEFPKDKWIFFGATVAGSYLVAFQYPDGSFESVTWLGDDQSMHGHGKSEYYGEEGSPLCIALQEIIVMMPELIKVTELSRSAKNLREMELIFSGLFIASTAFCGPEAVGQMFMLSCLNLLDSVEMSHAVADYLSTYTIEPLNFDLMSDKFGTPFAP